VLNNVRLSFNDFYGSPDFQCLEILGFDL